MLAPNVLPSKLCSVSVCMCVYISVYYIFSESAVKGILFANQQTVLVKEAMVG